jgi:DNA-binding CsgD family transcriptional regulator
LEDKSNKDIADTLFVSLSTVKTHVNNVYRKLNVQTRDEVKSLFNN